MEVNSAIIVTYIHLIFLFHLQECEIHEAFFSGDCSKASSFCKHQCINIDKGFICTCNHGYQLQRDGQSCQKIPDQSFNAVNNDNINSIHSSSSLKPSKQHSMQSSGDQIIYNKQTGRHHVVLGHSKLAQGPVKDNIVLGSGSLMPPMSIMRPPTCDGVLCQNGGHCVVRGSRTKCNCPFGFGGTYCQKAIPVKYPMFEGDGYLAFPELTDSNKEFKIELEFRPDSSNGLILFSAEMKDAKSDFFSIAIVNGFIEFRFDCGTGEAILKTKAKVNIGDWNTVTVARVDNSGSVILNNQGTVSGYSKGAYSELTMHLKLYLGGYIDMGAISNRVGVSHSFRGCIQTMKINGRQYDMRQTNYFGQAEFGLNVDECSADECSDIICQNGGRCIATSADQHTCLCSLGWSGQLCQKRIEIHVPGFNGHSFVRHQGLERSSLSFTEIEVVLKPTNWEGLILYNGYTNDRKGDYISLAMREGHLEFQFDLGTGPGVLRSIKALQLNAWHHVRVTRTGLQGILEVDDQIRVEGNSEGGFTQLTLLQDLYIGGHDYFDHIPKIANLTSSFHGCLQKVIINGRQINIVSSAKDGVNIDNCDHHCVDQPCMNAGECEPDKETYTCYCPLGFSGRQCEYATEDIVDIPYFGSYSYLMYTDKQILDRINGDKIDVQFKIKPKSSNGLILWSSKTYPVTPNSDYMALGMRDGALILQYDLGSGSTTIIYNSTNLFDGKWHSIKVQRDKQDGFIMVDDSLVIEGTSPGSYTVLNTNQVLYIGGMPDISHNSQKKFTTGFKGCLKDILLAEDYEFDFVAKARNGRNIKLCSAT